MEFFHYEPSVNRRGQKMDFYTILGCDRRGYLYQKDTHVGQADYQVVEKNSQNNQPFSQPFIIAKKIKIFLLVSLVLDEYSDNLKIYHEFMDELLRYAQEIECDLFQVKINNSAEKTDFKRYFDEKGKRVWKENKNYPTWEISKNILTEQKLDKRQSLF